MFNAELAPITRSVALQTSVFNHGDFPDLLEEGEVVHSITTDWEATAEAREAGDLKWSESFETLHITTVEAVRAAEAAEASKPIATWADIWPAKGA